MEGAGSGVEKYRDSREKESRGGEERSRDMETWERKGGGSLFHSVN